MKDQLKSIYERLQHLLLEVAALIQRDKQILDAVSLEDANYVYGVVAFSAAICEQLLQRDRFEEISVKEFITQTTSLITEVEVSIPA